MHTHTYTHPSIYTCIHTYTYILPHTHIHTYTYIHIHTHLYIHIYTYIRTYTCIYTSIHPYTHPCKHAHLKNVVYVLQVGTGYSFTDKGGFSTNEEQVATNLYSCLTQFFAIFSDYKDNDFYLTGEVCIYL